MSGDPGLVDPTIRVVSDDFLSELERLLALEESKRKTPMDDPAFPELAREVEAAARSVTARAAEQAATAAATHDAAVEEGSDATIEDLPADLSPAEVLALWRDAERERAGLEMGSARWSELGVKVAALRRAYQRSYERER